MEIKIKETKKSSSGTRNDDYRENRMWTAHRLEGVVKNKGVRSPN